MFFRFGAHNWEGPGALTAMSAMFEFEHIVESCDWLSTKVDSSHVIFAGEYSILVYIFVIF